jgi:hydrogenase maturation protein HypF
LHNQTLHLSQFLGDLEDFDAQEAHGNVLHNLTRTLQSKPRTVLVDMHPGYHSTRLGQEFVVHSPHAHILKVQHHKAHAAAVLADNDLLLPSSVDAEPVLGVVWDGVGYGTGDAAAQHTIWGSEFLWCKRKAGVRGSMERVGHLEPFPYLHRDAMSRQPALSAFALLHDVAEAEEILRSKFTTNEWTLHTNAVTNPALVGQTPLCSSMGRLFDAAASLLGLCDYNNFESEAAMLLEAAADRFFVQNGYDNLACLDLMKFNNGILTAKPLLLELLRGVKSGFAVDKQAAQFHCELVGGVRAVARSCGAKTIACTGGVFQNAVLVELLHRQHSSAFQPYFHKQLSPNDENISFGQMMYYLHLNSSCKCEKLR